MSSLVELPAVGSSPGYTIKLFTDPLKHSKTYEIKHGDKIFTVVENNHEKMNDDESEEIGFVRSLQPVESSSPTTSSTDNESINTNFIESKTSSFEQRTLQPKLSLESSTNNDINTNFVADSRTLSLNQQQQQQQQQQRQLDASQLSPSPTSPNNKASFVSSTIPMKEISDVSPSQKTTNTIQEDPTTKIVPLSISSQVKETIPQSSLSSFTSVESQKVPSSMVTEPSSLTGLTTTRKQVETPKAESPKPLVTSPLVSSKQQQQLDVGDQLPSVSLQSTTHKEILMNGQPQQIISSYISEDYNNKPLLQDSSPSFTKPFSTSPPSSTTDKVRPDQLIASSKLLTENSLQPLAPALLKTATDSIQQFQNSASAGPVNLSSKVSGVSTLSDLVKSSTTTTKDSNSLESARDDNHDNNLAASSIVPSTLKSLEKLKTLLPTFIGTRKAELPSATTKPAPSLNTMPSSTNNIINSMNAKEQSNENAWSQEIKGVTSLSSSVNPPSNDDLFNKALNADIVLK